MVIVGVNIAHILVVGKWLPLKEKIIMHGLDQK